MASLKFTTAGESHGPGLVAVVEGLPAGLEITPDDIDRDLARRQLGHGRGGRMKIESDRATVWGGIRHGRTLGSPVALLVANRDHENWAERMNPWPVAEAIEEVHLPRPGHADLAGGDEVRPHRRAQRAGARERPGDRGACGGGRAREGVPAPARHYCPQPCRADRLREGAARARSRGRRTSSTSTSHPCAAWTRTRAPRWWPRSTAPARRTRASAACSRCGRSASPPGLGSHVSWDTRIDARIAWALMSIHAMKGVEIGDGFDLGGRVGLAGARRDLLERGARLHARAPTAPAGSRAA